MGEEKGHLSRAAPPEGPGPERGATRRLLPAGGPWKTSREAGLESTREGKTTLFPSCLPRTGKCDQYF